MSTEQKPPPAQTPAVPHHKEHLETNALGQSLISGWAKFKAGQLISYKWMGIILIAVTAIGLTLYIIAERSVEGARRWAELETANSRAALEKFAEQNPNTLVGNVAQLDLARVLLGPDGIERIPTSRSEAERKTAVGNIEKSREMMTKLLEAFKDQPLLKLQCLVGIAKAEATLIGMNKEGSLDQLGSVDKLIEWLDKIGEAADGTPWGDDAKKMSSSLKSSPTVKEELVNVQRTLYTMDRSAPGLGPLAPGKNPLDGILGGFPTPTPPGPITPTPKPPEPGPITPAPKPPEPGPKPPEPPKKSDTGSTPKPPDPKPPEPPKKTDTGSTPKPPDPKPPEPPKKAEPAPAPKPPDPKPPDPKPPEPPKKP